MQEIETTNIYSEAPRQPGYGVVIETAHLPEQVARTVRNYQLKASECLFEISCLSGLSDWTSLKGLPSKFCTYFQKAIDLYDESLHYLLGHLRRQGFSVQCEPGCAHCCSHMPVGVSVPELVYLYFGMHKSGGFPRFFRRCLEAEEQWSEMSKSHCHSTRRDSAAGNAREVVLQSYHQLEHYCPFLQDRRCQVYPYRPIACRMHFSLSSPHWCNPSHFQHDHAVRFNLEPGEKVFEALEQLESRLQLQVSDVMVRGLLELSVNVMKCEQIRWIN